MFIYFWKSITIPQKECGRTEFRIQMLFLLLSKNVALNTQTQFHMQEVIQIPSPLKHPMHLKMPVSGWWKVWWWFECCSVFM